MNPANAQTVKIPAPSLHAIECPECAAAITAAPTLAGEILDCAGCGAELEAVSLQPLVVQLAPKVEEDWGE